MGAVGSVFGSWMNERAILYRRKYKIPDEWGTDVNVRASLGRYSCRSTLR